MNNHKSFRPSSRAALAAGLVLCGLLARPASAATLTWGTSGTGGSGTWNTSNNGWWNGTTNGTWVNSNNDIASFGGTAGTVTLSESISAGGLTFATTGYTLTGGTLTLANTPTITVNATTATVASVVSGSTLAKAGTGTLILSGSVALSGSTSISLGTLQFSGTGTVGDISLAGGSTNSSLTFATGANMTTGAISRPGYGGTGVTIQQGATVTSVSFQTTQPTPSVPVNGTWTLTSGMRLNPSSSQTLNVTGSGTINTLVLSATTGSGGVSLSVRRLNIGSGGISYNNNRFDLNGVTIGAYADWSSSVSFGLAQTTTFNTLDSADGTTPRTITLSGALSGTGGLTKSGDGTLTLSGSNSYVGTTTVSSGTLLLANGLALQNSTLSGSAGTVLFRTITSATFGGLAGSQNLALSNTASAAVALAVGKNGESTTYSGTLSGVGSLTKLGSGTLALAAENTYGGATTVGAGVVRFDTLAAGSGAQALGSGSVVNLGVAATSAGELDYVAATSGTLDKNVFALGTGRNRIRNSGAGTLTLSGTLTKNGTILELAGGTFRVTGQITGSNANSDLYVNGATVTLSNANNDYVGPTYVYGGGTLVLGANNVIPEASTLVLGGTGSDTGTGTLDLASFNDTVAGVTLTSGSIIGSGTLTAPTYTLAGGVVTANLGTGTVSVKANSTLNGTSAATVLNLNAGALTLGSGGSRFTGSPAVSGSSGASLTLGGNESFGSLAGAANIALGNFTLSVGSAGTSGTYAGSLSGAGGLTKTGAGTLSLSGSNAYTGITAVNSGTLAIGAGGALPSAAVVTLGAGSSAGFLVMQSTTASASSVTFNGTGSGVSGGRVNLVTGTAGPLITVTTGSASWSSEANLAAATSVNVSAGANFTLSGAVTGLALTKLGSGTLSLTNAGNTYASTTILGGYVYAPANTLGAGTITLGGGSILDVLNSSLTNTVLFTTGSGAVINSGTYVNLSGTGSITSGTGSTITTNYNVLSSGSFAFVDQLAGAGLSTATVQVQSGAVATLSGGVGATGDVTVLAGGVGTFTGAMAGDVDTSGISTFGAAVTGNVKVNGGTATFNTVATGALSQINVYTGTAVFSAAVGGFAHAETAAGTVRVNGDVLSTADINANAGGTVILAGSGTFGSPNIDNDGSVIVDRTANLVLAAAISGSGSLTKSGANRLALTGNASYTGATTITGGTLSIGDGGTSGVLGSTSGIAVGSGALLAFNRTDNYGGAFNSLISGSGNVRVETGYLNMLGLNTYTGTTNVLSGATLAVNGSLANTALLVDAGAALKGSGTIAGLTTIAGLHAPGNSPGIQTFLNLSYASGASVQWELWGNAATNSPLAFDQIVVNGNLAFDGVTALNLVFTGSAGPSNYSTVAWNDSFWNANQQWLVYDVAGTTSGFGNLTLTTTNWQDSTGASFGTALPGSSFTLSQVGQDVYLNYVVAAVPEPGTLALAGIGIGGAAWSLRRRRRSTGTVARQR